MNELSGMGKIFIFAGSLILLLGLVMVLAGKIPYLGNLPGDFKIEYDNYTIYIPITTMVILSLLLSLILNLLFHS